jgi:hypothetical protein
VVKSLSGTGRDEPREGFVALRGSGPDSLDRLIGAFYTTRLGSPACGGI